MRISIIILWLVVFVHDTCHGQHLIGVDKNSMVNIVRKEMKGFNTDNSIRNQSFNYLKFINTAGTKTLFVFFDDKDICTNTRLVCDYGELEFVLNDLNQKYTLLSENNWKYTFKDETFLVNLEKKEWYFNVSTKKVDLEKISKKRFFWWKRQNY